MAESKNTSDKITVVQFTNLYGVNPIEVKALQLKYKAEKKTKNQWIKEVGGSVNLRRTKD